MSEDIVRHSKAAVVEALSDPEEIAKKEAFNSLLQAERMNEIILTGLHGDRPFKLRPSILLDLNRKAIEGLSQFAGLYRPSTVEIQKSKHQPPGAYLVPELVEQMCDYVNEN